MAEQQLILEPGQLTEISEGITKIIGSAEALERVINTAVDSLNLFSRAEKDLIEYGEELHKILGLKGYSAMKKLDNQSKLLAETIKANSAAFADEKEKIDWVKNAITKKLDAYRDLKKEAPETLMEQAKLYGVIKDSVGKFMNIAAKTGEVLKGVASIGKQVIDFLDELDIVSSRTAKQFKGFLDGVGEIGEGLIQIAKNPIAGTISIISGVLKAGAAAWKYFAEMGIRSAIDEERNFIEISEETEDKIIDLSKKLDDKHAAVSMYITEIIKGAKINQNNFEYYVLRTAEVIDDYKNKHLTLKEVQDTIGAAFPLLLKEAQKLGTEGSKSMETLIRKTREEGMKMPEIHDYVNKKLEESTEALSTYLSTFDTTSIRAELSEIGAQLNSNNITLFKQDDLLVQLKEKQRGLAAASKDVTENWNFMESATLATFAGFQEEGTSYLETVQKMSGVLNKLGEEAEANGIKAGSAFEGVLKISDFVKDNETLVKRIDSTNKMMTSLHDGVYLTKNAFHGFGDQAVKQFDAMVAAGLREEEALMLIAPQLNKLNDYASRYNVTLSDQVRNIVEKGRTEGLIATQQQEHTKVIIDLLSEITIAMGRDIPESAKKMREKTETQFKGVVDAGESLKFKIQIEDVSDQIPQIIESVRGTLAQQILGPEESLIKLDAENIDIDWAKDLINKWLPKFEAFVTNLNRQGIQIDLTNLKEVHKHIIPFKEFVKQEYKLNIDTRDSENTLRMMFDALAPIIGETGKTHELNINTDNAKQAIASVKDPWDTFKATVESSLGIKLDTSQVQAAIKGIAAFFKPLEKMGAMIGFNFNAEEIISSLAGLETAQEAVNKKTEEAAGSQHAAAKSTSNNTTSQEKLTSTLDKVASKYGLMKTAAIEPTKQLKNSTKDVLAVFEKYKGALEKTADGQYKNAEGAAGLKAMLKDQLDLFDKFGITAPAALREASRQAEAFSTKQLQAKRASEDLALALGKLKPDQFEAIVLESASLIEYIDKNTKGMDKNSKAADKVREAIGKNIEKYKGLENVTESMKKVAIEWGYIDKKTGMAMKTLNNYSKSMGAVDTREITEKANLFNRSLELNIQNLKDNPEMVKNYYRELQELNKNSQFIKNMPDDWDKNTKALTDAYEAMKKLEKENKLLGDWVGYSKKELDKMAKATDDAGKKNREFALTRAEIYKGLGEIGKAFGASEKDIQGFSKNLDKLIFQSGTIEEKFHAAGAAVKFAGNILESMGVKAGKATEALSGLLNGIGDIAGGFSQLATNPIGGAFKILGGTIKAITGIFKLFAGDGVGEAIDRERELVDITEETEKKIRELEKTLDDTHAATSMLLSEIIAEADVNKDNFADYAQRTRDILCDLDRGTLSLAQTKEALGSSFNQLLSNAQRLGTEGSKEMLNLLRDVRHRGLEVAEIQEYVNEKLSSGADALKDYLSTFADTSAVQDEITAINDKLLDVNLSTEEAAKLQEQLLEKETELQTATSDIAENWDFMAAAALSTFNAMRDNGKTFIESLQAMGPQLADLSEMAKASGIEISGGLKEMTDLALFMEQNQQLTTRINATNQMMVALGDSAYMTQKDFTNFATNSVSQFDQLVAAGASEKQALMMLGPQLDNLIKYHTNRGFAIDAETEKLIIKARAEGALNNKTLTEGERQILLQERMVDILTLMAERFGVDIPEAMSLMEGQATRSIRAINDETGRWHSGLGQVEKQFREGLTDAIDKYDKFYKNKMTGNSIVTETDKWKYSLEDVDEKLGKDLVDTARELDLEYSRIMRKTGVATRDAVISNPESAPRLSNHPEPLFPGNIKPYHANGKNGNTYNEYFIFENINLHTENGEDAVRDFMNAFKDNKLGVKNMIRRAVR